VYTLNLLSIDIYNYRSLFQKSPTKETIYTEFVVNCTLFVFRIAVGKSGVCGGVALISRLLKIVGLFCKRALQKRLYSAKETYNFKEPTSLLVEATPYLLSLGRYLAVCTDLISRLLKIIGLFCRI